MRWKSCLLALSLFCSVFPVLAQNAEQASARIKSIELRNLSWLIGSWQATQGQQSIDEHWSLQGDSLLGISRTMEGKQSKAIEILLIEKQAEDYVLRLRFFGPAIDKATRGKDQPLRLRVTQADIQQLQCEGIDSELGTTLTYTKLNKDEIRAHIRKVRDGTIVWQEEYTFSRSTP